MKIQLHRKISCHSERSEESLKIPNCGVLITRPAHQANNLAMLVAKAEGVPILFPTIEIAPAADLNSAENKIKKLDEYSIAIFQSANAVNYAISLIKKNHAIFPANLKVIAIGEGTSRALENNKMSVDFVPRNFSSEKLLEEKILQNVHAKKIIIFKGEGGRDLLEQSLILRRAEVAVACVYQRKIPTLLSSQLEIILKKWQENLINFVVCTSNEGLQNLNLLLGAVGRDFLRKTPVIGVSQRMLSLAEDLQIEQISIANNASDHSILEVLHQLNFKM